MRNQSRVATAIWVFLCATTPASAGLRARRVLNATPAAPNARQAVIQLERRWLANEYNPSAFCVTEIHCGDFRFDQDRGTDKPMAASVRARLENESPKNIYGTSCKFLRELLQRQSASAPNSAAPTASRQAIRTARQDFFKAASSSSVPWPVHSGPLCSGEL